MVYLLVALAIGVVTPARDVLRLPASFGRLYPALVHLLVVGWLTQLIFGVAYWMFPRRRGVPITDGPAMERIWIALNVGLLLRLLAEPQLEPSTGLWAALLVVSAALQWLATVGFAVLMWPRVFDPAARK
jgi:hypothetical protein